MRYRLLEDSVCRSCMFTERCQSFEKIEEERVWKNMKTGRLVTMMSDGCECFSLEDVEAFGD